MHDLSHDQDTTDLHKAITAMVAEDAAANGAGDEEGGGGGGAGAGFQGCWLRQHRIFVVGALGGRLDHEMSHMSAMHEFAETNIVLLGRTSLAMLIPPGTTTLRPDPRRGSTLVRQSLLKPQLSCFFFFFFWSISNRKPTLSSNEKFKFRSRQTR